MLQDAIGQVQLLLEESLPSRLLHHERLGEGCIRESVSGTINLLELLYLKQYMYLAALRVMSHVTQEISGDQITKRAADVSYSSLFFTLKYHQKHRKMILPTVMAPCYPH